MGTELFHSDKQTETDRHDDANTRLTLFSMEQRAYQQKMH
jgi:hypothetical protein